jgi:hypothetical protein
VEQDHLLPVFLLQYDLNLKEFKHGSLCVQGHNGKFTRFSFNSGFTSVVSELKVV